MTCSLLILRLAQVCTAQIAHLCIQDFGFTLAVLADIESILSAS